MFEAGFFKSSVFRNERRISSIAFLCVACSVLRSCAANANNFFWHACGGKKWDLQVGLAYFSVLVGWEPRLVIQFCSFATFGRFACAGPSTITCKCIWRWAEASDLTSKICFTQLADHSDSPWCLLFFGYNTTYMIDLATWSHSWVAPPFSQVQLRQYESEICKQPVQADPNALMTGLMAALNQFRAESEQRTLM